MISTINLERLRERVASDAVAFRNARPFPHIVLDDLLADGVDRDLHAAFPMRDWDGWRRFEDSMQVNKHVCPDIAAIPQPLDRILFELNSGPFLSWLGELAGIEQLVPDPWLEGGGLHCTSPGGRLVPHTDFHYGHLRRYFRRINLLLYLNPQWTESNGGALELWDKKTDRIERKVIPTFGRCVIFRTDFESLHGFSDPVAGADRKSLALYYYTNADAEVYSGDYSTHWRVKVEGGRLDRRMKNAAYTLCMKASRHLSRLAWLVRGPE